MTKEPLPEKIQVDTAAVGQRLDVFCVQHFPAYSRSTIQKAIKDGQVQINGRVVKPRYTVADGDTVTLTLPEVTVAPADVVPAKVPIIHEDRDIMVINKPAGMVVHPGQGQEQQSVAGWARAHCPAIVDVGDDPARPGIVHRLDKDTSGVLILAKNQKSFEHLKEQFSHRRAHKEYLALVFGAPGEPKGRINRALMRSKRNPLRRTIDPAGKEAITEWRREESFGKEYALLRVFPLTGRTHQIRVHLHFLGFPIVGDNLYTFKRQRPPHGVHHHLLHAEKLTLTLPNGKRASFTAPLPPDFVELLVWLRAHTPPPVKKSD